MDSKADLVAVGIGEVLWDVFPDESHFGGAPANFAAHCASFQTHAYVVSRIGTDELGKQAQKKLNENGIDARFLQIDPDHPTGTVQVQISDQGKASYEFADDTAWDHLQWQPPMEDLARNCDVVCFGTLGQRSPMARQAIRQFVESTGEDCLRVLDVNLRQQFYDSETIRHSLHLANAFKLNEEELPIVLEQCGMSASADRYQPDSPETRKAARDLMHRFQLRWLTVTAGDAGAALFLENDDFFQSAPKTEVDDTVGAGDSFTAALVCDLLRGRSPASALQHAIQVAGYVCTQPGATPPLPDSLREIGD